MVAKDPVAGVSAWHSRLLGRLVIAALVLLAEYLCLTVAFDAGNLTARGGVWGALALAGNLGSFVIAGTAAFLLVPRLHRSPSESGAPAGRVSRWMLLLHAALIVGLTYITYTTFSTKRAPPGPAMLWVVLWFLFATATTASLLTALVHDWRWLLRMLGRVAAIGGTLGILAWVAGALSTRLWEPLSHATFVTVAGILRFAGLEVFVDANTRVIDLEGFAVEIAPMCSGFEGVGMYAVLMSAFLYKVREELRFPRSFLLLPIGMLLVWLGNSLRIAALMFVGARVDPDIALGSFHSKAGWVFFAAITIAVAIVARKSRVFARQTGSAHEISENVAAPLVVPLLTWTGVGLVTSMFGGHHDLLYGVRVVVAAVAIWAYRRRLVQWCQAPTALSVGVGLVVGVIWLAVPVAAARENSPHVLIESLGRFGLVWWIALRCIGAIVVVPVCEELAFRAYLARRLTQREFWTVPFTKLSWFAVIGSAVTFGAVHERWALGTVAGLAFVALVRRTGRLADGIVAHAISNAVIAAWVLTTGAWEHW